MQFCKGVKQPTLAHTVLPLEALRVCSLDNIAFSAMQRQYEVLASAHKELLQRMETLMTRPAASDVNEPADGLKVKLAAAHCLIEDLQQTKKQHEDVMESLSMVRTASGLWGQMVQIAVAAGIVVAFCRKYKTASYSIAHRQSN
jgi:hypothetical protein